MDWNTFSILIPAVATFVASLATTVAVRTLARRAGVFAYPDRVRRFHAWPVPLWGGVAVYLATMAGLSIALITLRPRNEALADLCMALVPAASLACLFGSLDDCYNLRSRSKLVLQLLSVVPIVAAGYSVDYLVIFGYSIDLGWLGIPLTTLWLLGCINALNLIDGMDGLACVVGFSAVTMMAIISVSMGNGHVAIIAIVLASSLAGFLIFNLPPASIYLGDSGSTMIGLVVGILGIEGSMKSSATLSMTAPAVIMTLPMFDVVMAVVRRKLTGRPMDVGDREHIHHRLLDRGLGPWKVLCILGALCLTTGAAATAATVLRMEALAWITATTLVVLMIRLRLFGHYEFGLLRGMVRQRAQSLAKRILRIIRYEVTRGEEVAPNAPVMDDNISEDASVPSQPEQHRKAA